MMLQKEKESNSIVQGEFKKQINKIYKMGPIISKKQASPNQKLQMTHPRFKRVHYIKQEERIQISVPFIHENQVKQWQQKFKKYINQECLLLPASYQSIKTGMCGTSGVCNIRFQNYPYVLKDEINDRIVNNLQTFQNKEIWYILFILLQAASVFHHNNLKLGDVRPINIFICDNGQTKVASQFTFFNQQTNFEKSLLEKQITYVAPQQMKHLLFKSQSNENFILAESFSIGLTLVDAVTLSNSQDIYNLNNFRIDYQKLFERTQKLKQNQKLDQILKQIILGLVAVNHEQRLNCDQVFKWLKAFKEEILNFQPFQILQWPFVNNHEISKTMTNKQDSVNNKPKNTPLGLQKIAQPLSNSSANKNLQDKLPILEMTSNFSNPSYRSTQTATFGFSGINNAQTGSFYTQPLKETSPAYDQFRLRLQKIDQQLARSRQLFPS